MKRLFLLASLFIFTEACSLSRQPPDISADVPVKPKNVILVKKVPLKTKIRQPEAPAKPVVIPVARPINVPTRLTGLGADEITKLLGPPSFTRHDIPAQIWRYDHIACVLNIFLYKDKNSARFTVAHAEILGHKTSKMTRHDCLVKLVQKRRKNDSGYTNGPE